MNNNKRFVIFVVALFFGFSFATSLKSTELGNAIMVYERLKNTIQDADPKSQFQSKRSAFIKAINQVLNPEVTLSSEHKKLVTSVLKVANIKAAQALIRTFIVENFPTLIQSPSSADRPACPSRVTAATSATTGRRQARSGASAASAAGRCRTSAAASAGPAAAVPAHYPVAAAILPLVQASAPRAVCAGPARTALAISPASAAAPASACDVAMTSAAAAAAPVQPSACAAGFSLRAPTTDSYRAMMASCVGAVPRVVTPQASAAAASVLPARRSPFQRLHEYIQAPNYPAVSAERRAQRLAAAQDDEPPVVGGPAPFGLCYAPLGDPTSWGIPRVGFVPAAQPYRPVALLPVASAAAVAAEGGTGEESSDSDGLTVVSGSGLLPSGRPIF